MIYAIITDDYLPHSTKVSAKMLHELALALKEENEIIVITPAGNQQQEKLRIDYIDGITVWRFKSGPIKNIGYLKRAINESLLSYRAWTAIKHELHRVKFDGLIYYSPSIFFGPLVKKIKKMHHCPSYLILRDLFPQWVIDLGMIKQHSFIAKYFRFFERINYEAADIIGLMSPKNLNVFTDLNPNIKHTEVLYNWMNTGLSIPIQNNTSSIRAKHSLENKVIFFYGGNIGHAQDMDNLMRLVNNLKERNDAYFLFIGQGDAVESINKQALTNNLNNFTYLPQVTQEEYIQILTEIDVGLFSLSNEHTAHNFPGKVLGYMAYSIPVLGSVNKGNDLIDVINTNKAGYVFENGDDHSLTEAATLLINHPHIRLQCGQNARLALIKQFSTTTAAQTITKLFKK